MGHSTGSGRASGGGMNDAIRGRADYVGDADVLRQVNDQLRHRLGRSEEYATADPNSIRITTDARRNAQGMGIVNASYDVDVRVPVGVDPETGRLEMETATETRTGDFNVRLLKKGR